MQFFKASVLAALVASVAALQVTGPAQGSSIDVSEKNTITWSSVSSDPSSFSIVLVNMAVNPSVSINVADNVDTSSGSYTMKALSGVTPGSDYQINLISKATQNSGILAQSGQFSVVSSGSSTSSASFSSSTPSTSGSSSTSSSSKSTVTSAAVTSSSSGSSSTSGAAASASASASGASSTVSSKASSASAAASSAAASASSAASSATAKASGNAAAGMHLASGAAGLGLVGAVVALFA